LREGPSFAMLLGWLEKFTVAKGLRPGRGTWRRGGKLLVFSVQCSGGKGECRVTSNQ